MVEAGREGGGEERGEGKALLGERIMQRSRETKVCSFDAGVMIGEWAPLAVLEDDEGDDQSAFALSPDSRLDSLLVEKI